MYDNFESIQINDSTTVAVVVNAADDIVTLVGAAIRSAEEATAAAQRATQATQVATTATNIAIATTQTARAVAQLAAAAANAANNATVAVTGELPLYGVMATADIAVKVPVCQSHANLILCASVVSRNSRTAVRGPDRGVRCHCGGRDSDCRNRNRHRQLDRTCGPNGSPASATGSLHCTDVGRVGDDGSRCGHRVGQAGVSGANAAVCAAVTFGRSVGVRVDGRDGDDGRSGGSNGGGIGGNTGGC